MKISKKKYKELTERIADLEKQVKYQQLAIEMCKKVDLMALEVREELKEEFQSSGISSSPRGSMR